MKMTKEALETRKLWAYADPEVRQALQDPLLRGLINAICIAISENGAPKTVEELDSRLRNVYFGPQQKEFCASAF